MPPKKKKPAPKAQTLVYPLRATRQEKNKFYTAKQREKDKDFNNKLELWRLDNYKALPEINSRIVQLKK